MSFLLAKDTLNGSEGSVVITIDGKNKAIAGMRNIRTNAAIQSEDMKVIGSRKIQTKSNGVKLSGTGNIYYGTPIFTDMVMQYIKTGNMPQFSIQITNDDPSTSVGAQTIVYYGCTLTGDVPMSILDDEQTMLNYDFNFSFTDVALLQAFTDPASLGN
jgi:hypothetical protein